METRAFRFSTGGSTFTDAAYFYTHFTNRVSGDLSYNVIGVLVTAPFTRAYAIKSAPGKTAFAIQPFFGLYGHHGAPGAGNDRLCQRAVHADDPACLRLDPLAPHPGGEHLRVVELRQLTTDIYRLSSASNNAAPSVYPSPVDTLRTFIAVGELYSNYLARTSLSPSQRADAFASVSALLASVPARPQTNIELRVRPDSFTGPCTVLETASLVPALKYLFHPGGEPYRLLDAFNLLPGTRVQVLGYTDMASPTCAGDGIEVLTLQLASIPQPGPTDLNGNLLPDEWEALFGISNPFADDDGDGYSNLQEMFDGTDPRDPQSKPAGPIVDLSPPALTVELTGGGMLKFSWDWPEPYASKVHFKILSTLDLGTSLTDPGLTPTKIGGHFEVTLPNPETGARFFALTIGL